MALFFSFLIGFFVLFVSLTLLLFIKTQQKLKGNLPPGHTGLPLIGETLEFISTGKRGHPEKFIYDRIAKYSSPVFKTHLLGSPAVVIGGLAGTKFLFSNENKLVRMWFPSTMEKIFMSSSTERVLKEEVTTLKRSMHRFLMPDVLQQYVGIMDQITQREFNSNWVNKDQVTVYPLTKPYTFRLACRLFLSLEDPNQVAKFEHPFSDLVEGLVSIPIDLPGTKLNRGIKAANFIRKELLAIMKQRKAAIAEGMATPTKDILSHMLSTTDEDGKFLNEVDIADKIMGLLFAGHDTLSSACTSVVRYLAEYPQVYQAVYMEQMKIANSKAEGEVLNWDDIRSMTYSSNVVSEVLRLAPPAQGGFRESITDFMYNGFSIPKGYKVYWSAQSTHRNPEYFTDPLKFDPSRFDGAGPAPFTFVPFGGGPRICPGRDYARLGILTFTHHLVRQFKWEKVIPDEKFVVNPTLRPEKGLPIRLYPHKKSQN